jgi:hypothetical protein
MPNLKGFVSKLDSARFSALSVTFLFHVTNSQPSKRPRIESGQLHVGLDLGTICSGYSFAVDSSALTITSSEKWPEQPDHPERIGKDLSCIMYEHVPSGGPDGKNAYRPVCCQLIQHLFGYQAMEMFLKRKKDLGSFYYAEKFMLILDSDPSTNGLPRDLEVRQIVKDYVAYMKIAIQKHVKAECLSMGPEAWRW